ncbi:homoserine dehydrogenase [Rhizobium sp. CRIBSB]|nr:homoserine dehydrogenase [Rhizobium sp. CRIBSB]
MPLHPLAAAHNRPKRLSVPGQRPEAALAPLVVLKFGGSLLQSPASLPAVVSEIYRHVRHGQKVVAVVSAFAGETDRLLNEARALGAAHENDLAANYVSLGEVRSAALTAVACDRAGLRSVALSVRDLGIVAEGPLDSAHPVALDVASLRAALDEHEVVVVPGFGAVRADGKVALLGRGGSDLTAVYLAAELGLERVRLLKDVDGLYDHDPADRSRPLLRYSRASWHDAEVAGGVLVQQLAIDTARKRRVEIEVAALGRAAETVIGDVGDAPKPVGARWRLKVAVAGCGVVGGGVIERLAANPDVELVGVLVRDPSKPRDVAFDHRLLTQDAAQLLAARPDLLVEALSDGSAGHALILNALAAGVDVVSANKQAISLDPAALHAQAEESGAELLYSAAVGGGSPMLETLRAARSAGPIVGFEAVLNGTVNFMLDRLGQGYGFDQALEAAKLAGFAEEDSSSDLEGLDAAAKVKLLAYEAFGEKPEAIACDTLDAGFKPEGTVRQLSVCRRENGAFEARVSLDQPSDPLFLDLRGERNALKVIGEDGRIWRCRGRGAGRWPTTESVLADVGDILRLRA